ncbi:hypothetical protein ACHAPU_006332 [Fusarium lateritium]
MSTSSLFPFALPDEVREHLGDGSDLFELGSEQSKLFFDAGSSEADRDPRFEAFSTASVADGPEGVANQYTFVSKHQRDAIVRGDYNLLNTLKNQTNQDLKANINAISKDRERAFLEVINSGGFMWVMPISVETKKASEGTINTRATVVVGSYSKETKFMGISVQTWTSIPGAVANLAISYMVSRIVAEFVANRVAGMIFGAALKAAVGAAEAGAVAGGFMVRAAAAKIAGAVAGGIVMLVAALVVMYIIDFIHKSYGLTLNIYNWSTSTSWVVNSWYSDNSKINDDNNTGGTGEFKNAKLDKVSDNFKGPDGFPIPTVGNVASFGTYTFANDSQWLQGLGVCMRVQNAEDPSIGFYLKYVVHRFESNDLGLQGNMNDEMKDYYQKGWAPPGSYVVETKIDKTDVPVKGITNALSGEDSHMYSFDVHIGVKPEGA